MKALMKILMWIVGVPAAGFAALFIYYFVTGLAEEISNPKTLPERIAESCQREFKNDGSLAVDECKLRTSIRYLRDFKREQDDRAYSRVR